MSLVKTFPPLILLLGTKRNQVAKLFAEGNLCKSFPILVDRQRIELWLMLEIANRSVPKYRKAIREILNSGES